MQARFESLEASILNRPDWVVFDIDPYIYSGKEAKGAEPEYNEQAFDKGKEVAFWLKELLESIGLKAIVKTSGKTGLHIFVPVVRTLDFDAVRSISQAVSEHLRRRHPKEITTEWVTTKRTGKIFMDYNMNGRAKTLNVAYSPRGCRGRRCPRRSPGRRWRRPTPWTSPWKTRSQGSKRRATHGKTPCASNRTSKR